MRTYTLKHTQAHTHMHTPFFDIPNMECRLCELVLMGVNIWFELQLNLYSLKKKASSLCMCVTLGDWRDSLSLCLFLCVCVCVCVTGRKRESGRQEQAMAILSEHLWALCQWTVETQLCSALSVRAGRPRKFPATFWSLSCSDTLHAMVLKVFRCETPMDWYDVLLSINNGFVTLFVIFHSIKIPGIVVDDIQCPYGEYFLNVLWN